MTDHPTHRLDEPSALPPEHPTQRLPDGLEPPPRPCLRCAGHMISAYALAYGYGTSNPIYISPQKMWNDSWRGYQVHGSPCYALVCPHCGYTELYTVNPQALVRTEP